MEIWETGGNDKGLGDVRQKQGIERRTEGETTKAKNIVGREEDEVWWEEKTIVRWHNRGTCKQLGDWVMSRGWGKDWKTHVKKMGAGESAGEEEPASLGPQLQSKQWEEAVNQNNVAKL